MKRNIECIAPNFWKSLAHSKFDRGYTISQSICWVSATKPVKSCHKLISNLILNRNICNYFSFLTDLYDWIDWFPLLPPGLDEIFDMPGLNLDNFLTHNSVNKNKNYYPPYGKRVVTYFSWLIMRWARYRMIGWLLLLLLLSWNSMNIFSISIR